MRESTDYSTEQVELLISEMDKLLNQNEKLSQEVINLQEQLSRKDSQNLEVLEQAEQWKEKACSQEEQIQRLKQEMSENLSANSMLMSKLQQKSETIRLLNDKIGRFHESDKVLKENINLKQQNRELQIAAEKAMTEVSKVKSDYAEKERILNTRQLKISNAKRNQNILIQRKAEELYKAKKYSQQAFNLSFLCYSCLITLFAAIRSETFRIDFTAFLIQAGNILKAVVSNAYKTAIRASEWGSKVQKQSLAIVLHNLLPVIVVLAALALVGFIIYIFIGLGKIYKKYFWDRLSLFITFFSLAGIIFFADLIRNRISINLITLFLLVQCVYIIFRSLARFIKACHNQNL